MKLKITQTKSTIACLKNHIANIQALGLKHVGDSVVREDTPAVRGMIFKVKHMVKVEEVVAAANAAFSEVCNSATLEKDRLVRDAVADRGMDAMVRCKQDNYNIRLEELLTGASEPAPYVVVGGSLVPKTGAVFLTPVSKNGRAPFYSSIKVIGGARVPTLLFNLCILLLMGIVLTIFLLINIKSIKPKVK